MSTSVTDQPTNHVPEAVAGVADLMSTYQPTWALCGGWAVDAWLSRQTRDHPDVDIAVFHDDQGALFDHLAGWQLVAHDLDATHQPWDGRHLELPNHIEARLDADERLTDRLDAPAQQGFGLDIQLNERSGQDWIFSREPHISLPLRLSVRQSGWGLPTVCQEVLLFYKATAYFGVEELKKGGRSQDEPDFLALRSHLTGKQRHWLRAAISLVHPDHSWLSHLSP